MKKKTDRGYLKVMGAECRRYRRIAGLTLEDVGKRAGVTRQMVSRFELGLSASMKLYTIYIKDIKPLAGSEVRKYGQ